MPITPHHFDTRSEMVEALTRRIVTTLKEALSSRGHASLVLSGGSTPIPLFELLALADLDWSRVWLTLADERWVAPDHEDSNERLVRTTLMKHKAISARFIGLKTPHEEPEPAVAACAQQIAAIQRPFDVVLLGMGGDGHTASLFPGATNLKHAMDDPDGATVAAIRAPGAPQPRMTLTLPVLLDCHDLILMITGAQKQQVMQQALAANTTCEALPVRSVLTQDRTPLACYWAP